jgi:hypothetical protein
MKNLSLIVALVVASASFTAKAQPAAHNSFDATGTIKTYKKVHTFVKNGTASTIADGSVVCLDLTADNGATVGLCAALGDPALCVVDEASGCAASAMCKCLVEGYKSNLVFDGSGNDATAGMAVYSDIDGKAAGITSPAATDYGMGVFLDSSTDSGSIEAYIRL